MDLNPIAQILLGAAFIVGTAWGLITFMLSYHEKVKDKLESTSEEFEKFKQEDKDRTLDLLRAEVEKMFPKLRSIEEKLVSLECSDSTQSMKTNKLALDIASIKTSVADIASTSAALLAQTNESAERLNTITKVIKQVIDKVVKIPFIEVTEDEKSRYIAIGKEKFIFKKNG